MRVNIGSRNPVKVLAVKETIQNYSIFTGSDVISLEVPSQISEQPKSLAETIQGAINRAKNSFKNCDYSFGIEDGLMRVPNTKTGFMNVCVCSIYDGSSYNLGLSSCFEYPKEVTKAVLENNIDIDKAMVKEKLTENERIGYSEGTIGFLTKGRLTRKEYTKQAVTMALIHLENKGLY